MKMEKLIDKNAALESVCHNCCCDPEECKRDNSYCTDYMSILNLPTIETKHGRWIEKHNYYQGCYESTDYKCSICGLERECLGGANYCPNCGAKMDLEEE